MRAEVEPTARHGLRLALLADPVQQHALPQIQIERAIDERIHDERGF